MLDGQAGLFPRPILLVFHCSRTVQRTAQGHHPGNPGEFRQRAMAQISDPTTRKRIEKTHAGFKNRRFWKSAANLIRNNFARSGSPASRSSIGAARNGLAVQVHPSSIRQHGRLRTVPRNQHRTPSPQTRVFHNALTNLTTHFFEPQFRLRRHHHFLESVFWRLSHEAGRQTGLVRQANG